jgi:hypothetical protein
MVMIVKPTVKLSSPLAINRQNKRPTPAEDCVGKEKEHARSVAEKEVIRS